MCRMRWLVLCLFRFSILNLWVMFILLFVQSLCDWFERCEILAIKQKKIYQMLWRQFKRNIDLVSVFVSDGFVSYVFVWCCKFDTSAKIDFTLLFSSFRLSIHPFNHPFSHHSTPREKKIPCPQCKEQTLIRHISEIDSVK